MVEREVIVPMPECLAYDFLHFVRRLLYSYMCENISVNLRRLVLLTGNQIFLSAYRHLPIAIYITLYKFLLMRLGRFNKLFWFHFKIDSRSRDILMSQHFLDLSQVSACFEH